MQHAGSSLSPKDQPDLRHSFRAAAIGIGLFLLLFALLSAVVRPFGTVLAESWTVTNAVGDQLEPSAIPITIRLDALDTIALETRVGSTDGDALALMGPDATAVEIFWNGRRIDQLGDPKRPTANLWNAAFAIPLPDSPDAENVLRLKLTSPYQAQLIQPPMIAPHEQVQLRIFLYNLVYQEIRLLLIGAGIAVGIILIFLAKLQGTGGLPGLLFGASAVLAALYATDYGLRLTTGSLVAYHWFRVAAISAGYGAALLFVMGLEQYFHNRFRLSVMIGAPIGIAILAMVASPSLSWLFRWLPVMNTVLFADFLLVLGLLFRRLRVHRFLLVPFAIIALSLLEIILVMALGLAWPPVLQFTVLLTAILFSVQIITDYTEVYERRQELEAAYNRDALTGAYNRHLIEAIELSEFDVAVVTDLDHFKAYNDAHGHAAGDAVLKAFAMTLASNTRGEDLVVRYGGDEFVVLIKHATADDAQRIMERVRRRFRWQIQGGAIDVSFGVESITADTVAQFTRADATMYAMKARHHRER